VPYVEVGEAAMVGEQIGGLFGLLEVGHGCALVFGGTNGGRVSPDRS
jgi:hypothetical protein